MTLAIGIDLGATNTKVAAFAPDGRVLDRRAVLGDRLIQLPLISQGVAQVGVSLGVAGIESDRGAVFGDRFLQLPLGIEDGAHGAIGDEHAPRELLAELRSTAGWNSIHGKRS